MWGKALGNKGKPFGGEVAYLIKGRLGLLKGRHGGNGGTGGVFGLWGSGGAQRGGLRALLGDF